MENLLFLGVPILKHIRVARTVLRKKDRKRLFTVNIKHDQLILSDGLSVLSVDQSPYSLQAGMNMMSLLICAG